MFKEKVCFSKKSLKTFVYVLTIITVTLVFGIYMYRNSYSSKANTITPEQACNNLPGCWGGKICIPVFNNTLPTKSYNSGYCCFGANQGVRKLPYPHFEKVTDNKCSLTLLPTNTPTPANCIRGQSDTYGKNYCNDCAGNIKYGRCIKYGQDWKRCKQCYNSTYNCLIYDETCQNYEISKPAPLKTPTITPLITIITNNINILPPAKDYNNVYKYTDKPPKYIVLHWNDDPYFSGNLKTFNSLADRGKICTFAVSSEGYLQMADLEPKRTIEQCVGYPYDEDSISLEINGQYFDLWIDEIDSKIVKPKDNPSRSNEKSSYKEYYDKRINIFDWNNDDYLKKMEKQTELAIKLVKKLMKKYNISKDNIKGHYQLYSGKTDPGERYLNYIKKRL